MTCIAVIFHAWLGPKSFQSLLSVTYRIAFLSWLCVICRCDGPTLHILLEAANECWIKKALADPGTSTQMAPTHHQEGLFIRGRTHLLALPCITQLPTLPLRVTSNLRGRKEVTTRHSGCLWCLLFVWVHKASEIMVC